MTDSYNELNEQEQWVLLQKGTEPPFTGKYTDHFESGGHYACRRCNAPLYRSEDKFHSHCGWPAFDDEVPNAITRLSDRSFGMVRTEIRCASCDGHLGHVFVGEGLTAKNRRHCVNSASIVFVPKA